MAAADTRGATKALITSALRAHLELMREYGDPVPPPTASAHQVEVG